MRFQASGREWFSATEEVWATVRRLAKPLGKARHPRSVTVVLTCELAEAVLRYDAERSGALTTLDVAVRRALESIFERRFVKAID